MNGSIINGGGNLLTENEPLRRAGILILCFIPMCYLLLLPGIIFAYILDEAMDKTGKATYRYAF
jgi:hypothetical protein